jgi:hypothetical protein
LAEVGNCTALVCLGSFQLLCRSRYTGIGLLQGNDAPVVLLSKGRLGLA